MNITFHECRYILHLKDYDSGVFFYREVLGLQPNYNWSIVPDQKGYRFYMGSGRLEITQIPFTPRQGHSEFLAQCSDLPLCMERILEEMPHIEILSQDTRQVTLRDTEGNLVHLLQDDSPCSGGDVDKTDMFTGTFTGVLYEDDLAAAQSFYCDRLGLPLLEQQADALLLQAGDAQLLLRRRPAGCTLGPSMIGLEASSVNKLYDHALRGRHPRHARPDRPLPRRTEPVFEGEAAALDQAQASERIGSIVLAPYPQASRGGSRRRRPQLDRRR